MTTNKILKSCNCCRKVKLVKATHNYANCCGGRAAFTALSDLEISAIRDRRAQTVDFLNSLLAEADEGALA